MINQVKRVKRIEERREKIKEKNKRYCKKIIKFIKKKEYSHISHVIFGHTHQKQDLYQKKGISIVNTGAWQHVETPSFVEIDLKGTIELKKF